MSENTLPEIPDIRMLTVADRKLVTNLFKKAIDVMRRDDLKNVISSTKSKSKKKNSASQEEEWGKAILEIAGDLITTALDIFNEDVDAWLADLINVTPEAFDKLPMNAETHIINQIRTAPEAVDFFTQCFQSAKMTEWLETPLRFLKERFGSILELEKENLTDTPS